MTTLDSKQRVARKTHKCNFCGDSILKGQKYDWQKLVFDGVLYEWKSHLECSAIACELDMYSQCDDGVTEEDFREFIREEYQNIMSDQHRDIFESEDFKYPTFLEQLELVKSKRL